MNDTTLLGPWIRRFLLEHLIGERNLSRQTQLSYRDTLRLLLPFVAGQCHQSLDQLTVEQISAARVLDFLRHLEVVRHCKIATRNQRLAAIRALAGFVAAYSPEHIAWCGDIRRIPFKKTTQAVVPYLEKPEMDALLNAPDRNTKQGHRDYALLLFLYNSGARASEAAQLTIADIDLAQPAVRLLGKGNKIRHCPLWSVTVQTLIPLVAQRVPTQQVFLNRCGQPITRFGIHTLVERCAQKAATVVPSLVSKRVSPHTLRHTTAVFLLRAGVDINTIRAWLGHVSINTTQVYAELDLEMKAKALASCEFAGEIIPTVHWNDDASLMAFLQAL
jgi:site-specific recombinase XerD